MVTTEQKDLEVYVCIDMADTNDITTIMKCIEVYINAKQQEFKLCKIEPFHMSNQPVDQKGDVVEHGLLCMREMFTNLKLKTSNDVWLIYLSTGNVRGFKEDVTLFLLNKQPGNRECYYSINKNCLSIPTIDNKDSKLQKLKILTKSFDQLFSTSKTIKYKDP